MSRRSKLSDAAFAAIQQDTRRSDAELAVAYDISIPYARAIRRGAYDRRPTEPAPRPTSTPGRFYQPFRDGTYDR